MSAPKITIDDSLRSAIEAFKAQFAEQCNQRGARLAQFESETVSLISARDDINAGLPVATPGSVLSHDDAVRIAAAKIRIDSITLRMAELENAAASLPTVPMGDGFALLCEALRVWREKLPELIADALRPFDPNPHSASNCLRILACVDVVSRIEGYVIPNSATGFRRLFELLDRVLAEKPYLGDDDRT